MSHPSTGITMGITPGIATRADSARVAVNVPAMVPALCGGVSPPATLARACRRALATLRKSPCEVGVMILADSACSKCRLPTVMPTAARGAAGMVVLAATPSRTLGAMLVRLARRALSRDRISAEVTAGVTVDACTEGGLSAGTLAGVCASWEVVATLRRSIGLLPKTEGEACARVDACVADEIEMRSRWRGRLTRHAREVAVEIWADWPIARRLGWWVVGGERAGDRSVRSDEVRRCAEMRCGCVAMSCGCAAAKGRDQGR